MSFEWISVKDRLPEQHEVKRENSGVYDCWYFISEPVLGYTSDGIRVVCYETEKYDDKIDRTMWVDEGGENFECTHWAPLPEPPGDLE